MTKHLNTGWWTMTREELITRIEAGETGPELLCAIAREVKWRYEEELIAMGTDAKGILAIADATKDYNGAIRILGIPDWLHSIDAAVALVGNTMWSITSSGEARVCTDFVNGIVATSFLSKNPAAALVAAYLKSMK